MLIAKPNTSLAYFVYILNRKGVHIAGCAIVKRSYFMELSSKKNTKKQIISTNNGILIRRTFALNEFQFELRLLRTADGKFELLNTVPQK